MRLNRLLCLGISCVVATACAGTTSETSDTADSGPVRDPIFETAQDPNVNPLLQVPADQVDLSKDVTVPDAAHEKLFDAFDGLGVQPGELMPDFTLWNVSGQQVKLSQFRGKAAVLLLTGSSSCFAYRDHAQPWLPKVKDLADSLAAKTGRKLEVLVVYTLEAHPAIDECPYATGAQWTGELNVKDQVLVRQTHTFAQRVTLARALVARYKLDATRLLLDGMDNAVWAQLGQVPNSAHLLDDTGRLVWKEVWAFGNMGDVNQPAPPLMMGKLTALLGQ